jgi:hypothetical protein
MSFKRPSFGSSISSPPRSGTRNLLMLQGIFLEWAILQAILTPLRLKFGLIAKRDRAIGRGFSPRTLPVAANSKDG